MNVLVTGGAGYVGSHTVLALLEAGHRVTVLDNLCTGHAEAVPAGVRFERADVREAALLLRDGGFEGVIHFAARALVEESMRKPELYYEANLVAGFYLLDAVRQSAVRRFVFSSSCSVYGVPDRIPIPEDSLRRPINPYGFTKAAFEQMLEEYRRVHGLGFAALRYFNAAGCDPAGRVGEDHDPETHLIPRVLRATLPGAEPFAIAGIDYPTADGTCVRDYVHVADLAAAHVTALEKTAPGEGTVLNLGTGRGHSVRQVLAQAAEVVGKEIPHRVGPRRPGDPPSLVALPERAHEWGWQPRCSDLGTIVETAWRWMQAHPRGYGGTA